VDGLLGLVRENEEESDFWEIIIIKLGAEVLHALVFLPNYDGLYQKPIANFIAYNILRRFLITILECAS